MEIFLQNDPGKGPVDSISSHVSEPDGIFIDDSGALYVANADQSGDDKVTKYPQGAHKPSRTFTGAECAFAVAVDSVKNVYVADPCGKGSSDRGRVIVFEHGGTKQTRYLYPGGSPYCLAVDSHDNLYVGYNSKYRYAGQVKRYAPGARRGETLLPQNTVYSLTGIAFDDQGALLVANGLDGVIDVFTRKREPPTRIIKTGQGHPFSFAFDQQGARLYVSYPCSLGGVEPLTVSGCNKKPNTVVALDYATGKRLWVLRQPLWQPTGVATLPKLPSPVL